MSQDRSTARWHVSFGLTVSLTAMALPAGGSQLFMAEPVEKDQPEPPEASEPSEPQAECPMSPADRKANRTMMLEGKCGEGKCGVMNLLEGKCGEGKCGAVVKKEAGLC